MNAIVSSEENHLCCCCCCGLGYWYWVSHPKLSNETIVDFASLEMSFSPAVVVVGGGGGERCSCCCHRSIDFNGPAICLCSPRCRYETQTTRAPCLEGAR